MAAFITATYRYIRTTSEYKSWGSNALTLGFVLSLVVTLVEAWGLCNQVFTLWSPTTHSVSGVSASMKLLTASYFVAAFNRGIATHRVGLAIGGLLHALLHIPILVGLWRLGGFAWYEWAAAALSVVASTISFNVRFRDAIFKNISAYVGLALVLQPLQMLYNHTAAGLNVWDPAGFLVSCMVWIFYGIQIKDKVVVGYSLLYAILYAATIALWFFYR